MSDTFPKTSDDEAALKKTSEQLLDTVVLTQHAIKYLNEAIIGTNDMHGLAAVTLLALNATCSTMADAVDSIDKAIGDPSAD